MKTPTSYYIELITTFPPRPITNDAELISTQHQINHILDKGKLTCDRNPKRGLEKSPILPINLQGNP